MASGGIGDQILNFAKIGIALTIMVALGGYIVNSTSVQEQVVPQTGADGNVTYVTQTITNTNAVGMWQQITNAIQNLTGKWVMFIGLAILVMIFAYFMGVFGNKKGE